MKKSLFIFTAILFALCVQAQTDTLYYGRGWKGAPSRAFAYFYRVIPTDTIGYEGAKPLRDYYITGELYREADFVSLDKYDDSKTILTNEYQTFFRTGEVREKGLYINGSKEGEYTRYFKNGLIELHCTYKNNLLHGLRTEFVKEGDMCYQTEFEEGKPKYDWYVVSNKDGYSSKVSTLTNKPIYDTPALTELKVEYRKGEVWPYYNKSGIMIGLTNESIRDYGKYFQIRIQVSNLSLYPIDFDPTKISATIINVKNEPEGLIVYSSEEYMARVRRRQNWAMALNAFANGLSTAGAGYSTATVNTSTYANGRYYNSSSVVSVYNSAAAYQASAIAAMRTEAFDNALLSERQAKDKGYLKLTTINPGETISGYVNIERKKGSILYITLRVGSGEYRFAYDIDQDQAITLHQYDKDVETTTDVPKVVTEEPKAEAKENEAYNIGVVTPKDNKYSVDAQMEVGNDISLFLLSSNENQYYAIGKEADITKMLLLGSTKQESLATLQYLKNLDSNRTLVVGEHKYTIFKKKDNTDIKYKVDKNSEKHYIYASCIDRAIELLK